MSDLSCEVSSCSAFPWSELPKLSRSDLASLRKMLSQLRGAINPELLRAALTAALGAAPVVNWEPWRMNEFAASDAQRVCLLFSGLGVRVDLVVDTDLAHLAVARLLGQTYEMGWPESAADPDLSGAAAAIVLDLARRGASAAAPQLLVGAPHACSGIFSVATLRLGGRSYRCEVLVAAIQRGPGSSSQVELPGSADSAGSGVTALAALGSLRVTIPWVAAVSWERAGHLQRLATGDVWMPGPAWFCKERGFSLDVPIASNPTAQIEACLAAPQARWGWPVSGEPGKFEVGQTARLMPAMPEHEVESIMTENRPDFEEVLGNAPVMVRLELGAVEMTAAQWSQLRPGDIVESGRAVGAPVQLRAGGQLLAEGQLIQIEGQIGVKILRVAKLGDD